MKSADDKRFKKQKTLYSARDREVAKQQNTTKKRQHGPDKGSHITTKTMTRQEKRHCTENKNEPCTSTSTKNKLK